MNCRDSCETCMRGSRSTLLGIRNSPAKGVPSHAALSAAQSPERPAGIFEGRRPARAFHYAGMLRASLPQEPEAVLPVEAVPRAKPSAPLAWEGTA